jgi:ubiquinone/menaquinone biosynthesis C-methylase UbiE
MRITTYLAAQLRRPSGLFGRHVLPRVLNRGNAPMNALTAELLDLVDDDHVLEVGFGGGDLLARLVPVVTRGRIVGVDFSPAMMALSERRFSAPIRAGRLALRCADVDALPCPSETLTKACTVNTIYFWPDPVASLAEIRRALRPGGRLVVAFNPPAVASKLPYTRHGFTLHEPEHVCALLGDAGFRDAHLVAGETRLGEFFCATAVK